jgi:flagellar motor switch protein FliN/FliY
MAEEAASPSDPLDPSATPQEEPAISDAAPSEPVVAGDVAPTIDPTAVAAGGAPEIVGDNGVIDQAAIDELLKQANFEEPSALPAADASALPDTSNFELPNFQQVMADAQVSSIDLLRDVELNVKIELGRSRMLVEDVLKLVEGSVVELDKLAGDPVDVFVNDRLVARGEVLVLNDNFCVRVNEIVAGLKEEGL